MGSLPQLVDALATAHALEKLHFITDNDGLGFSGDPPTAVAHLPRLQSLAYRGFSADFCPLFDAMRVPPTASLYVHLYPHPSSAFMYDDDGEVRYDDSDDDDGNGTIEPSMLSAIVHTHRTLIREQSGYKEQKAPGRVQFVRVCTSSTSVCLKAFSTADHPERFYSFPASFIDININLGSRWSRAEDRNMGAVALGLCRDMDFRSVREICVDVKEECYDWDPETCRNFLSLAHPVESVRFCGAQIRGLLEALSPASPNLAENESASSAEVLLPRMRDIYLEGVCPNWTHPKYMQKRAYDMRRLPGWIRARRAQRAPIERLTLEKCSIPTQTIEELRAIEGLALEWDGEQGVYGADSSKWQYRDKVDRYNRSQSGGLDSGDAGSGV